MKGAFTIAWRDFRALVSTPMFFIVAGLCAAIWSFVYIRTLDEFSQMALQQAFRSRGQDTGGISLHFTAFIGHIKLVNLLMIIFIPVLTMRLLAEEKKLRTFDLLLTSPVSATDIAIGKFLAGFGVATVLLLISFLYPLSTLYFTPIQWGPLLSSYLGLWLLVGGYVAIGVFASSLSDSVVLAVVMAVIFNFSVWFLGTGVGSDDPTTIAFFEHISLNKHLGSFLSGSIQLTGLVFFLSLIGLNCFLTQRVVESSRWR